MKTYRPGARATFAGTAPAPARSVPAIPPVAEPLEGRRLLSGSIKGTVYLDASGDGKRNHHEQLFAGVEVYLDTNDNGQLDPGEPAASTNKKGKYQFKKLAKAIYHVREIIPDAYDTVNPAGGAWFVDLRRKQSASGKDFGYWAKAWGPTPVLGKGPITNNDPPISIMMYNTAALQSNNADGTNDKGLLDGSSGETADPYWAVEPPSTGDPQAGDPPPFGPAHYAFNPSRYNGDLQPGSPQNDSAYVSPAANGLDASPAGLYAYATAFDLTGIDPTTVEITGLAVPAGQITDVRLNGESLGLGALAGQALPLALKSGFVPGINTLEWVVSNATAGPTGLRVDGLRGTGRRIKAGPIELFNTAVAAPNALDGSNRARIPAGGLDPHWLVSTPGPGFPFYTDDSAHHYIYNNSFTTGRFGGALRHGRLQGLGQQRRPRPRQPRRRLQLHQPAGPGRGRPARRHLHLPHDLRPDRAGRQHRHDQRHGAGGRLAGEHLCQRQRHRPGGRRRGKGGRQEGVHDHAGDGVGGQRAGLHRQQRRRPLRPARRRVARHRHRHAARSSIAYPLRLPLPPFPPLVAPQGALPTG